MIENVLFIKTEKPFLKMGKKKKINWKGDFRSP